MLLSILHTTCYDYAPAVDVAHHVACLQPMQTVAQALLSHTLTVTPTPSHTRDAVDVFGNHRSFLSLQMAHAQLTVVAASTVSTRALAMRCATGPWELAADHFRYRCDGAYDPDVGFVFASRHVPRDAEFAAYAHASFGPHADLHAATLDLMHRIHHDFTYDGQSTEIHTPAHQALRQRRGVCQDFAHIMLACLRSLGLSARYVSGYLLTHPAPGTPRLVGADATHAWLSLLLPNQTGATRWCDFDPTNDRWGWGAPGEDYVVLAVGRDFADVSPIRGVIHGGASHALTVQVTVEPLDLRPDAVGSTLARGQSATASSSPLPTASRQASP